MKKISFLFLCGLLVGCGFVVRDEQQLKTVGIKDSQARETIDLIDRQPEERKVRVWPLRQKDEE